MGITMIKLETKSDEATLFLLLTGRGRLAYVPYYQSVESYDEEAGTVIFARLDCAPADCFKVGVAGNSLITTKSFEHEIFAWLRDWEIEYTVSQETFDTPADVMNFFLSEREKTKVGREEILQKIKVGLIQQGKRAEKVSLGEYELTRNRGRSK